MFLIYSLCAGGAQRVLVDAANGLSADDDLEITVQTLFHDETYAPRLDSRVDYRPAFRLSSKILRKSLSGFIQYILPPKLVYQLFFRGNYDVEIAFMEAFPTKILAASSNSYAKKYAWVHIDVSAYTQQDRLFRSSEHQRQCYERFDRICCVSESVRDAFIQKFNISNQVCTLHNVLDETVIRAMQFQKVENVPVPPQKFCIVSVGSLIPRKGFKRLIHVCARLKQEGFSVDTYILGEGPQRKELIALLEAENLTKNFHLIGFQSNPYPFIAKADLYVCSSHTEGYSTAVCEALILGVPVVTTDCAGMREILGEGKYGVIAENNEEALYHEIHRMLCESERRELYRQKAIERAAELRSEKALEEYKSLLKT